ncbi:MAG TPA: hypothetical protein VGD56_04755 [Gemmatirosa sp.]
MSALIGVVYEAGLDPSGAGWPAVLERASPLVSGDGAMVLTVQRRQFDYARTHYIRTDPADAARFQTYYVRIDPVLEPVLPHAPPGAVLLTDALMERRALRRTEFYADWLRPLGIGAGAAAVLLRHGSAQIHLYAVRPRQRGPVAGAQLEALTLLLPHLTAALGTTLRLVGMGALRDGYADVVSRAPGGVILVDAAARVCVANRAAERLLAVADGLSVEPARFASHGRLRAATPAATAALHRLVAEAAGTALSSRGGSLALPRPSGEPPLAAHVAPLSPGATASAHWLQPLEPDAARAVAVVFIANLTATADPAAAAVAGARLQAVYGLTPAEAIVAVAVAQGEGLATVAAANRVVLATVRTQAQHAYRKTGVRGQAGLARLVERLGQHDA